MIFTDLFISGSEIFIILFAVLLLFGANKLPEIARGLGKGMNEFKKATNDIKSEFDEHTQDIQKDIKSIKSDLEESTCFDYAADNYFRDDDDYNRNEGESESESNTATDTQTDSDTETTEEDVYEEPSGHYSGNEENAGESSGDQDTAEQSSYTQRDDAPDQEDYPENEDQTGEGSTRNDSSSSKENQ